MAVKRSQNWLNQQRVDVPHLRSIESAVRNDFDEMFAAFVLGESQSYVIRGFDIEMAGSIGASANGLQLIVEDSAILHGASDESGTFFELPAGESNQVLSATTNTRVEGAFTPGALNYVSLEFTREVDDTTTAQTYLWNPTTQSEITKTLPLAETLDYKIVISSSLFTSNVLPIAIVETDSSNNVLNIQDRRPMLFRLGTAGSSTPDPFHEYPWDNHTEGRQENFWQSSSSTSSPFRGGDKQIRTFKENDEALKTEIKQIKGTTYWYSENNAGSLTSLKYDLGHTIFTGRGYIEHNSGNPGQINWDENMFLTVVSTRLKYKIEANPATTNIDLDDNQVAYVKLIRGIEVIPQLVFTNGADEVTSVGAIPWTTDLEAGDYVKVASEGDGSYYQILSVDSTSQVTLTQNFGGTSTGINGTDAKVAWGNYRTDAAPSTDRHIKVANIEDVPFDADTYWLFMRADSAGQARVYLRFLNAELEVGEQLQISDQVPAALLAYIGSANDSDSDPLYNVLATDALTGTENYNTTNGENLTIRSSKLTSMVANKAQDKTITFGPDYNVVTKTTSGANQEITFTKASGTANLNIFIPSSNVTGDVGLGGTLTLAANQTAYFLIDRNSNFSIPDLSGVTVANTDTVPLGENVFVLAVRDSSDTVWLWDDTKLVEGDNLTLGEISDILNDNAYEEDIAVIAGVPSGDNEINGPVAAGSNITMPLDSRDSDSTQLYIVGEGALEVYLNGQLLSLGTDWAEVGVAGSGSNVFETLIDLELGDIITVRIDTAGGYVGGSGSIGEANDGTNLGAGEVIFAGKSGLDLQFKTIIAGTNVVLTQNANELTISAPSSAATRSLRTVAATDNILAGDDIVLGNAAGGGIILSLPDASTVTGKELDIKKIDASANVVTIDAFGAQTIDGAGSIDLTTQYQSRKLVSDGSVWHLI